MSLADAPEMPAETNGTHVPGPGPVTDTFDGQVTNGINESIGNSDNSSDSGDVHGVTEINNSRRLNGSHRHMSRTSMALTDYSVNPSTPSDQRRQQIKDIIPEDFLLPNGHPDVCNPPNLTIHQLQLISPSSTSASSPAPHQESMKPASEQT